MAGLSLKRSRQAPAEETSAFAAVAERFRRAGDLDRAIDLCREGLQRFPHLLSARVTLGWALLDKGAFAEAQTELQQVLKRAPDNLAAIRGLAELHDRMDGADGGVESWHQPSESEAVEAPKAPKAPARAAKTAARGKAKRAASVPEPAAAPEPEAETDHQSDL